MCLLAANLGFQSGILGLKEQLNTDREEQQQITEMQSSNPYPYLIDKPLREHLYKPSVLADLRVPKCQYSPKYQQNDYHL